MPLYEDDTEGCAENRKEIEDFDGLFGIEHHASDIREQSSLFEVLILNWEQYHKGKQAGEWLPLPADAETLRGLFERIGADGANGSYAVANVRMPMYDILRYHISKRDSLDELNMLASYMSGMEDYELDKLQAILTSGVTDIRGITDLINLLDEDNFNAFSFIDAADTDTLGRYYADENNEKPDGVTFEQYGYQCVKEESGVFTKQGYIYCRYGELLPEYTGVVPDEYKIVDAALQVLRSKTLESSRSDEKLSVVDKIRASRQAQREPKDKGAQTHKKDKGGQEH